MNTEILCQYSIPVFDQTGYFVMDASLSCNDLQSLVKENFHVLECYLYDAQGNAFSDDTLSQASAQAAESNTAMELVVHLAPQEPAKSPVFGPILSSMAENLFGIRISDDSDIMDVIHSLPGPLPQVVESGLRNTVHNPEGFFERLQSMASDNHLPAEIMVEVENLLNVAKEKYYSDEKPQEKPEEEQASVPIFGPIVKTMLLEFGIEVDDEMDPFTVIHSLPFPFAHIAESKLKIILEDPEVLEDAVRGVSICFGVDFEELKAEVTHSVKVLRKKLGMDVEEEIEISAPEIVNHPATCDKCGNDIVNIRYKCIHCPDYDLCMACESIQATEHFHNASHVFAKMYKPSVCPLQIHPNHSPRKVNANPLPIQVEIQVPEASNAPSTPRIQSLESSINELRELIAALNDM